MEDFVARINDVIKSACDGDVEISSEMRLTEDLGFDSLGVIDLVTAIEDEFDIMLPTESIESVETVGDIYSSMQALLQLHAE